MINCSPSSRHFRNEQAAPCNALITARNCCCRRSRKGRTTAETSGSRYCQYAGKSSLPGMRNPRTPGCGNKRKHRILSRQNGTSAGRHYRRRRIQKEACRLRTLPFTPLRNTLCRMRQLCRLPGKDSKRFLSLPGAGQVENAPRLTDYLLPQFGKGPDKARPRHKGSHAASQRRKQEHQ